MSDSNDVSEEDVWKMLELEEADTPAQKASVLEESLQDVDLSEARAKREKKKPRHRSQTPPRVDSKDDTLDEEVSNKSLEKEEVVSEEDISKPKKNMLGALFGKKKEKKSKKEDDLIEDISSGAVELTDEPEIKNSGASLDSKTRNLIIIVAGCIFLGVLVSVWPVAEEAPIETGPVVEETKIDTLSNVGGTPEEAQLNFTEDFINGIGKDEVKAPEAPSEVIKPLLDSNIIEGSKTPILESGITEAPMVVEEAVMPMVSNEISLVEPTPVLVAPVIISENLTPGDLESEDILYTKDEVVKEPAKSVLENKGAVVVSMDEINGLKSSIAELSTVIASMAKQNEEKAAKEASERKLAYWLPEVVLDAVVLSDNVNVARVHIFTEKARLVREGDQIRMWNVERIDSDKVYLVFNNYSKIILLNNLSVKKEEWESKSLPEISDNRTGLIDYKTGFTN